MSLTCSPRGRFFAVGANKSVMLFDREFRKVRSFAAWGPVRSVAFSPDGVEGADGAVGQLQAEVLGGETGRQHGDGGEGEDCLLVHGSETEGETEAETEWVEVRLVGRLHNVPAAAGFHTW